VKLTTHFHPEPKLEIREAVPTLPLWSSWHGEGWSGLPGTSDEKAVVYITQQHTKSSLSVKVKLVKTEILCIRVQSNDDDDDDNDYNKNKTASAHINVRLRRFCTTIVAVDNRTT